MSFLPSLFLLSQFPACWASCHFHCTGFPLCSASTTWAFAKLGFCCAWFPPCWAWAEVVSARLNPSHGTRSGECVVSSVLSCHSKDLKWQTSVTALLQLSFIWQAKDSTPLRHVGRPTPKGRPQSVLASSSYMFVSSLPWACPMQIGLAKKGRVCFSWSSHSSPWIFFCSIFAGFSLSLSFSHHHFGLLVPALPT